MSVGRSAMSELEWEHGPLDDGETYLEEGEHDAGDHVIFEGPNPAHGVQYTITVALPSLEVAYRIAQKIENVLVAEGVRHD